MALWRIHISLTNTERSILNTEKTDISSRLDVRLFDTPADWTDSIDPVTKKPRLSWMGRFRNRAGADALKNFLDSRVSEWKLAGITGMVSRHLCTHDEVEPVNCSTNQYSEVKI